jgi:SAM-dependent methyltransferase
MNKQSKRYEENYFQGWFKGAVGDFSDEDMRVSRNWFYSWIKVLNKYVPLQKGKKRSILEIGCSIGAVASLLFEKGFEVDATDISSFAVTRAKKLSPKINFFTYDVEKAMRGKKKYDVIIAFEVVEHLAQPEKALRNMFNLLHTGGYVVISTPFPYDWAYADPTHINVKYPDEWLQMLKKTGFKKVSFYKFSLIPFFYRFNRHLQIIMPFHIPVSFINNPIFYVAKK